MLRIDSFVKLSLLMSALCLASPVWAQDYHRFTWHVGGGFTGIGGDTAGRLDHGGNLQAGAGFNFNEHFGITGSFMFHQLGLTRSALNNAGQPDGNARVYSFTVDPTIRFPLLFGIRGYALAGGGWMRRTVEFTQPTVAQTVIFDPWWGYFGPALIPVNQILGSVTTNAGAVDAGLGIDIPLPRTGIKLYVEGRYMHGFTDRAETTVAPLTVGIRW